MNREGGEEKTCETASAIQVAISQNKVVHEIARLAKYSAIRNWFEEPMVDIVSLFIDDVTVIFNQ